MKRTKRRWEIDWFIFAPCLFLLAIGFVLQSSIAYKTVGVDLDINLSSQFATVVGGIGLAVLLRSVPLSVIRRRVFWFYILTAILLLAVLVFGAEAGGSRRWLVLGSAQIQPTELAKVALIATLANVLDTHRYRANSLRLIALSLLATLILAVGIALQPDLGSAIVLVVIWLGMLLASRMALSRLAFIVVAIITGALLLVPFLAEYQQERLVSYFNPNRDSSGASYNVTQAGIAVGSGGLIGKGLTGGSQSQLNFLPSQHTDFAFAVLAEKLGLVGAGLVLLAMAALLLRLFYRAWRTTNQYNRLLFVGIAMFLSFHIVVNVGMNLGLVPVTGLPLPFISYGGTFMMAVVLAVTYVGLMPLEKAKNN